MSGLEVVGAVAAVVSAFHGGAELVAHIKKKQRRRSSKGRSQQEFEEKQLQDSLETGETQVGLRYTQDLKELGELMKIGDAIARDRLLHIAVVMQAEVIKSLQLACKYENAVLNLKILHEASIVNRKDSIATLDELKQRIIITRPLPRTLASGQEQHRDLRASMESMQSFQTANITQAPDNYLPSAVTIPAPSDLKDSKLARYFSMKRNSRQPSVSSPQRPASTAGSINFSPALNHLIQGNQNRGTIMKDIDEIISSYQGLYTEGDRNHTWALLHGAGADNVKRDTLAILNGGVSNRRDTYALNQDAILMLKNLPPTPEEMQGQTSEYPTFNHNVFEKQPPTFSQYYAAPSPLPQRMAEQHSGASRWSATSASSSVYSDTIPPSLYSRTSISSNEAPSQRNTSEYSPHESPVSPVIASFAAHQHPQACLTAPFSLPKQMYTAPSTPPSVTQQTYAPPAVSYPTPPQNYAHPPPPLRSRSPAAPRNASPPAPLRQRSPAPPPKDAPPIAPLSRQQRNPTPPNAVAPFAAPFATPSRGRTPPIVAPFAFPQRPRTPTENDNDGMRAGRTRVHLVPSQLVDASAAYGISTTISSAPPPPMLKDEIASIARRNKTPSPSRRPSATTSSFAPLSHTNSDHSTIRSSTIQGATARQEKMMDGRPCKDNNYWGFCKGAWNIREETKRGLGVQSVPNGMYNTIQIWQCKSCLFQGETFSAPHPTKKGKKETVVDPNIHASAVGIRYKWIFLAKSHVKKKTLSDKPASKMKANDEKEDCNYGCTICSVEGNVTGIYGNVETLMNHIFLEHTRTISEKTMAKTKCIVGRVAAADEEWDVNIPMVDVLLG